MAYLRFFRRFKILPGVRLNLSKSGISFSLGVRGINITMGRKGRRMTVGAPGTGLFITSIKSHNKKKPKKILEV